MKGMHVKCLAWCLADNQGSINDLWYYKFASSGQGQGVQRAH